MANNFAQLEQQHGLPMGLLSAVMSQESGGDPNAVSPAGARGPFQLMPATAQQYGVTDPTDINQAASAAAQMYGELLSKYNGDLPSALAGYNWGQGNVDRKGLENAPPETQNYIASIQNKLGTQNRLPQGFQIDQSAGLPQGFQLDNSNPGMRGLPIVSQPAAQDLMLNENGHATPPDFADRMQQDLGQRVQNFNDIKSRALSGQEGVPYAAAGTLGQGAGLIADTLGNATGSITREIPQSIKQPFQDAATWLGTTYPAQAAGYVANQVNQVPELQDTASAIGNLSMAKGAGELAAPVIENIAKATPLLANFAKDTGKIIADNPLFKAAPKIPTAEELRANASQTFKSLPADEVALTPSDTNNFLSNITSLTPQTEAGKIVSGDNLLTKLVDRMAGKIDPDTGERIGGLRDKPMALAEAQEVDEALGDHIDGLTDTTTGRLTKQGKKILDVQTAFRDAIEAAGTEGGGQLSVARKQWAQAVRMNDIERIVTRAQMSDNPASAIKTGFRTLYNNPARMKGFTKIEAGLIKNTAESGIISDALRTVLGSRLNPILALHGGGPVGALAAHGAAMGSRSLATQMQLNRANKVANAIAKRPIKVGK